MGETGVPGTDARDVFSREEFLIAWRTTASTILTEAELSDIVNQIFDDRSWVFSGDLIGALAIQSENALARARTVWGDQADRSASRVRAILNSQS